MAVLTFNPATGEQKGRRIGEASWAAARDATTSGSNNAQPGCESNTGGGNYDNYRGFEPFDTSSIPDGSVVTGATLQLYRDDSLEDGGNGFDNGDTTTAEVVVSTQADPTAYANTDYDNLSFVSKGSFAFASTSNGAYFSITVDPTVINITGYTKLCVITGRDLSNSAPTGENRLTWQGRGAANPPILTVTYNLAGGVFLTNFV